MKLTTFISTLLSSLLPLGLVNASPDGSKNIYGYVEHVNIQPENIILAAKLDTGALTASLNAIDIKEYTKNGEEWVSFNLRITDTQFTHFEKKLKRTAKIKQRLNSDAPQSLQPNPRPVVMMEMCMKQRCKTIEVNLANRSNFEYPLLLGRHAMIAFDAIIDPSQQYIQTNRFAHKKGDLQDAQ